VKIVVDTRACKGYANCIIEAPDIFDLDDDSGKSVVTNTEPGSDLRAELDEAVRMCPVQAISLQD
jgi:ferredoxin